MVPPSCVILSHAASTTSGSQSRTPIAFWKARTHPPSLEDSGILVACTFLYIEEDDSIVDKSRLLPSFPFLGKRGVVDVDDYIIVPLKNIACYFSY